MKISASYTTSPLTNVCNKVLAACVFLSQLKYSEKKPLHKKGAKNDIADYRSISVLLSLL